MGLPMRVRTLAAQRPMPQMRLQPEQGDQVGARMVGGGPAAMELEGSKPPNYPRDSKGRWEEGQRRTA